MNKEIIKLSKISKKFIGANKDIIVLKNINLKIKEFKKLINQKGKRVAENYEYNSLNNTKYLSVTEIKKLNKKLNFI